MVGSECQQVARFNKGYFKMPSQDIVACGVDLPLLEVALADLVESVCADGNHTAKDGETRKVLAGQVALVSDGLVASGGREIPV